MPKAPGQFRSEHTKKLDRGVVGEGRFLGEPSEPDPLPRAKRVAQAGSRVWLPITLSPMRQGDEGRASGGSPSC